MLPVISYYVLLPRGGGGGDVLPVISYYVLLPGGGGGGGGVFLVQNQPASAQLIVCTLSPEGMNGF